MTDMMKLVNESSDRVQMDAQRARKRALRAKKDNRDLLLAVVIFPLLIALCGLVEGL